MSLQDVDSLYTIILKLHSTYLTAGDNIAEKSNRVLSWLIKDLDKPTHSHLRDLTQNEGNIIHLGQTTAAIIRALSSPASDATKYLQWSCDMRNCLLRDFILYEPL